MTLFRVQHNKNYTCINNTICTDKRLSWKAKGIWLYAFSRPDDWKFYLSDIINQSTDGKDSVNAGLRELQKAGYLKRCRRRDEKGQLTISQWDFLETPSISTFEPKADYPILDKPILDNPPLLSTDVLPSTDVTKQGIDSDIVEALPSNSRKIEGSKYPLKKEQIPLFESLLSLELECDEKTLAILIRTHEPKKLEDAITHLKYEINKGTIFKKKKIAFFRNILNGKVSIISDNVLKNKKLAEMKKNELEWHDLTISDKFVTCEITKKEIPLNLTEEGFFNCLKSLYDLSLKY